MANYWLLKSTGITIPKGCKNVWRANQCAENTWNYFARDSAIAVVHDGNEWVEIEGDTELPLGDLWVADVRGGSHIIVANTPTKPYDAPQEGGKIAWASRDWDNEPQAAKDLLLAKKPKLVLLVSGKSRLMVPAARAEEKLSLGYAGGSVYEGKEYTPSNFGLLDVWEKPHDHSCQKTKSSKMVLFLDAPGRFMGLAEILTEIDGDNQINPLGM